MCGLEKGYSERFGIFSSYVQKNVTTGRARLNRTRLTQGSTEFIFTGRNEVVAKVIFVHLSVILFTGGMSASVHADTPLPEQTPPRSRHPQAADIPLEADTPLGADNPPRSRHPPRSRLWYTVNERPVRILLECILVFVKSLPHSYHFMFKMCGKFKHS